MAPALRLVGDALFDVLNEAHEWGTEYRDGPGIAEGELRAAAKDLDHLVEYLEEQVEALEEGPGQRRAALARATGAWAGRLSRVLVSMKEELDRYTAAAEEADA